MWFAILTNQWSDFPRRMQREREMLFGRKMRQSLRTAIINQTHCTRRHLYALRHAVTRSCSSFSFSLTLLSLYLFTFLRFSDGRAPVCPYYYARNTYAPSGYRVHTFASERQTLQGDDDLLISSRAIAVKDKPRAWSKNKGWGGGKGGPTEHDPDCRLPEGFSRSREPVGAIRRREAEGESRVKGVARAYSFDQVRSIGLTPDSRVFRFIIAHRRRSETYHEYPVYFSSFWRDGQTARLIIQGSFYDARVEHSSISSISKNNPQWLHLSQTFSPFLNFFIQFSFVEFNYKCLQWWIFNDELFIHKMLKFKQLRSILRVTIYSIFIKISTSKYSIDPTSW